MNEIKLNFNLDSHIRLSYGAAQTKTTGLQGKANCIYWPRFNVR